MKKAKLPTLSIGLAKDFFAEATAFYEAKPWESCSDADLFGVLIPETSELHFVSVMGGGGQCYGIGTYRGLAGLEFFDAVASGAAVDDPDIVRKRQSGLLLEFVSKKFLDDFEKDLVKSTGFKAIDRNGWILVRELSPGWMPWFPKDSDLGTLRRILSVIPDFAKRQKADPEWTHSGRDEMAIYVWQEQDSKWKLNWWGMEKIEEVSAASEPSFVLTPMDEVLVTRLGRDCRRTNDTWEAHSFFSNEPVLEGDRPFFPRLCVAMDQKKRICLGVELSRPTDVPGLALRNLFLKKMQETGVIPATIAVTNTDYLIGMVSLKEAFDIELKLTDPEAGADFESSFREKNESRL